MKRSLYTVSAIILVTCAVEARADLYGFDNITNNNTTSAAIGEAQLFVDVSILGGGQAVFEFLNIGSEPCSITDIYFDDDSGVLQSLAWIDNSDPGVMFSVGASPPNLPGGGPIGFASDFAADADPPPASKGVNPGESVGLIFDLTALNVMSQINSGDLRIGIHVQAFEIQGFEDGFSESFVNQVPLPSAVVLGALGLGLIGWLRNRYF